MRVGQEVRVEWTDGLVYSSKVLGCKMAAVYQVQWSVGASSQHSCHLDCIHPLYRCGLRTVQKKQHLKVILCSNDVLPRVPFQLLTRVWHARHVA